MKRDLRRAVGVRCKVLRFVAASLEGWAETDGVHGDQGDMEIGPEEAAELCKLAAELRAEEHANRRLTRRKVQKP